MLSLYSINLILNTLFLRISLQFDLLNFDAFNTFTITLLIASDAL